MKYIFFSLFLLVALSSFAQSSLKQNFNTKNDLALEGYDPVSYFEQKPQKGSGSITSMHNGIKYRFASHANKQKFETNPNTYEPQYGGWCAYAMGLSGEKVKVDPKTFKIINNKLYLFYNFWGNNTLDEWNKSESQLKNKAETNWSKILR